MAQNIIDNNTQQIIKRYTIIYKAIFQYSIYFIPFILGIIWAWTLQSSTVVARTQIPKDTKFPSFAETDWIYKAAKISDEVWPILNWFWNVKILWWELQATWNIIIWRNNLITLGVPNDKDWGIILPNRPYVVNMWFTGWLKYFTNKDYKIDQLKRVIDNWILSIAPTWNESSTWDMNGVDSMFFRTKEKNNQAPTNMEQVLKILQERMFFEQLQKWGGTLETPTPSTVEKWKFIEENGLTCMFWLKIIDIFCDINVNKLIKALPEVSLDNARADLLTISKKITKKDQVDAFCSNLMINILKKPYPTAELDTIMLWTCKDYDSRYERLTVFLWVQNEMESIVWENLIGADPEFNIFKLVSIQQKLYAQHKDKLLDTTLATTYLRFLSNLINDKTIKIPQFYIEESYYFNNIYLKSMLKRLTIETVNPTVNDEVSKVLDVISNTNKWNWSVWIVWLDSLIINNTLRQSINGDTWTFFTTIANFEQTFTDTIRTFAELRASALQTDETTRTARFVGILQSVSTMENDDTPSIPVIIDFGYKDGKFYVTSIRTPQNEWTDKIVQEYMKKTNNTAPLSTLIYIIQSNIDNLNPDLWLCNILMGGVVDWVALASCTKDTALIKLDWETLTLNISNNIVISWVSSNPKRQTLVNSLINNNSIDGDRVMGVLKSITQRIIDEKEEANIADWKLNATQISIMEKMKKFLGTTPGSVVKSWKKRLVSFSLKDFAFASVMDVDNNYKLSPLVINAGGKNITISSFSLSLINIQQQKITQFKEDPLLYIKQIDATRYQQIMKAIADANWELEASWKQ